MKPDETDSGGCFGAFFISGPRFSKAGDYGKNDIVKLLEKDVLNGNKTPKMTMRGAWKTRG